MSLSDEFYDYFSVDDGERELAKLGRDDSQEETEKVAGRDG